MQPFHKRLAELWWMQRQGLPITEIHQQEWRESLTAHMNWTWKISLLRDLSSTAYRLEDARWMREIDEVLDELGSR